MSTPIGPTAPVLAHVPAVPIATPSREAASDIPAPAHTTGRASGVSSGRSSYEAVQPGFPPAVTVPPGAPFHPGTDPLPGLVPVSAQPPSIHLPIQFEIRDSSQGDQTEISVEAGTRALGKLTGDSDTLVYASPGGKVEAVAERIPSRMGRGKDFLVRDAEGGVIGILKGSWNNRYTVLDATGNEVARVMPKVGRNNFVVRSKGRDVALISHPTVRELGGQWKVAQEVAHKIDPRLLVILPAITLFKNREVRARVSDPAQGSPAAAPSES